MAIVIDVIYGERRTSYVKWLFNKHRILTAHVDITWHGRVDLWVHVHKGKKSAYIYPVTIN